MANVSAPFGFRVVDSEGKEFRVRRYTKKSGNAIFRGDTVIAAATGDVDVAVAGGQILGIAMESLASTSTADIAVCDDPAAVFVVQVSTGACAAADVFQNANILATAGDTGLSRSLQSLDMSTKGTSAALQWKIIGLEVNSDNAFGSFANVRVKPCNHVFNGAASGV